VLRQVQSDGPPDSGGPSDDYSDSSR
jgi:hypothetical protein